MVSAFQDELGGLDPTFLKENSELVENCNQLEWDDINSLNDVVSSVEKVVLRYKNPNQQIKNCLDSILKKILFRYPLLFGYWKKLTAIRYQLFGLEKSIETLSEALELFPASLELWCDYLNVLCANRPNEVEFIREKFMIAKNLIGYQFLSDSFWDKYIEFESKNSDPNSLVDIYKELITIPLHQYARYSTAFKKLLSQNMKNDFNITENDIDKTIKSTQLQVNSIWPFESRIKQSFFNLTPVKQEELENWNNYLEFLISSKSTNINISKKFIDSTFERCFIPCQFYEHFWSKYTGYLISSNENYLKVIETYEKGTKILPKDCKQLRLDFIDYLKKNFKLNKDYIFEVFGRTIAFLNSIWPNETNLIMEYLVMLKRYKYSAELDQTDKEILEKQTAFSNYLNNSIENYLNKNNKFESSLLQSIINDNNISVLVVELIKINWLVLKNTMQTIKYFNQFSKNPIFQNSVSFWLIYYKFEKNCKNFTKLNKFIDQLGTQIILPTQIMNDILDDYKSFYLLKSNISAYQATTTKRLHSNELLNDPILFNSIKCNNPNPNNFSLTLNVSDWHKTVNYKSNGHPGIIVEKPQITNPIMEQTLKSFNNTAPPLPSFRNIEKINHPIKYDDAFSTIYLQESTN
ncbi:hypothetical protein Kpol_1013p29 [Vanderwaltozyma polyspora DSM 70294]|uniref:Suppressor of forked domain-containing protein n=1 Tax=Vanderwaltozyma polyspora (strain ATCC 22028 / DSM 70294 / BCRC 21397 / CBS 2163 / NBRC 10782 / NRRL Y-8283 / UCD 57-17) TaxID=436907 RepID=A7TH77_VANPO|nr:uncharacterized protein Kpol_1013p29 [Vanderwaltozyma polyspora DSM 70294]EDO18358.1 hypothetical protein Kpol_1013p29 [Vanderwaltozyma polyspora DSM 70294]